jgi:TPR repeat protein
MEEITCLNFDVRFTKGGSGYRAEVVESPGGTGQHSFAFPFHERDLENYLLKIGNRRSGMRSSVSAADEAALEFGNKLFETVFCGELETAFEKSLEVTRNAGSRLRIRLHLGETPELADLPWEYLYQSRRKRFLARSDYFPVVRYFDLPGKQKPLAVTPPLRVLVMLSNPSDVESLEVEDEYKKLKEAVKALEEEKLLAVERLGRATLGALQERLRKDSYHIFHFIGHGQFDPVTKQSFLALEHENGRMRLVSGVDIGSYLSDEHSLRLAILNACEGGRASVNDATSGVAQSLVLQGIPAVIAMQFEVSDKAAIALAGGFYEALADNYPVDAALSEARKAIHAADCGVEWGTPVLYLHAPDGRIFDIAKTEGRKSKEHQRKGVETLLKKADTALELEEHFKQVPAVAPGEPKARPRMETVRPPEKIACELATEAHAALNAEDFDLAEKKLNQVLKMFPHESTTLAQLETIRGERETANLYKEAVRHHKAQRYDKARRLFLKLAPDYKDVRAHLEEIKTQRTRRRAEQQTVGISPAAPVVQPKRTPTPGTAETEPIAVAAFSRPPRPDELKVIEAFNQHLRSESDFHVWPNIPDKKLTGAKSTFLRLRQDELLLALYDCTAFMKHAKDGFALTTKRIYWRNQSKEPANLAYKDLVSPISEEPGSFGKYGKYVLGPATEIDVFFSRNFGNLPLFLQAAALVYGTQAKINVETNPEDKRSQIDELLRQAEALALDEDGVPKNLGKAAELCQQAADYGSAIAQHRLAGLYADGLGVPKDLAKAVELYQKAADQGYAAAQCHLGARHVDGDGVPKDLAKAVELFKKAADQGYAVAQGVLGAMYADGLGVPKDLAKAVELLQQAADQGYPDAQCQLGAFYADGDSVPKDLGKAVELFQQAADQGHAAAQGVLGVMYADGWGVRKDLEKAVELFQQAADQGHAGAKCRLGVLYADGDGVPKDLGKAVELLQQAADQGDDNAQCFLGVMYENGLGVRKNLAKAREFYQKAADQGNEGGFANVKRLSGTDND